MLPAQRAPRPTRTSPVAELRLRLVVQHQLALARSRGAARRRASGAWGRGRRRLVVEGVRRVLALGAVHRHVGALDQELGRRGRGPGRARSPIEASIESGRSCDRDRAARARRGCARSSRDDSSRSPALEQQEPELVAAQARDGVRARAARPAAARRPPSSSSSPAWWPSESLTSLKRSRSIISDREPRAVALGLADRLLDAVAEQQPVRQPGEGSCSAWCSLSSAWRTSASSARLRSVMFSIIVTREARLPVADRARARRCICPQTSSPSLQCSGASSWNDSRARPSCRRSSATAALEVVGVHVVAEADLVELVGAVAQHLLERRVRLDRPAVVVRAAGSRSRRRRRACGSGRAPRACPRRASNSAAWLTAAESTTESISSVSRSSSVEPLAGGRAHHVQASRSREDPGTGARRSATCRPPRAASRWLTRGSFSASSISSGSPLSIACLATLLSSGRRVSSPCGQCPRRRG